MAAATRVALVMQGIAARRVLAVLAVARREVVLPSSVAPLLVVDMCRVPRE